MQTQTDCFYRSVKAAYWRYLINKSCWFIFLRGSVEPELQYWVKVFKSILTKLLGLIVAGEGIVFVFLELLEADCCLFDFLRFDLLEVLSSSMPSSETYDFMMSMTSLGRGGSFWGDFGRYAVLSFLGARFARAGESDSSLDDSLSLTPVCSEEDFGLPRAVYDERFCVLVAEATFRFWPACWSSTPDRGWELLQSFCDLSLDKLLN